MQNALTAALGPFLGTWRLNPQESRYELGQPPLDGAYTLSYDGERLHFDIEWTAPDGLPQRQAVDALPDGQEHPYVGPGVDSICYTVVDAVTLDSTASNAGRVVAHARRVLQAGGRQMEIVQAGTLPGGGKFANRSLYRRVSDTAGAGTGEDAEQATLLLLERFNRALNAHDVGSMMTLMSDDCSFENTYPPPDGERLVGQADVGAFWHKFFAGAPTANLRIEELVACGDRAFGRWVYDWGEGHVRGIDIFRVQDGKIVEKLSYVKG